MNSRGYKSEVTKRLRSMPAGSVFGVNDFADIASGDAARQILKAAADSGMIERVQRGIYYKPRKSSVLREMVPPRPDDLARAIARANKWTITPSGQAALNALGLSTQVPVKWTYVSDGPYKSYSAKGVELNFKRRMNRETTGLSQTTLLVVQALKALGKDGVGETEIAAIARRLSHDEKATLLSETERATAWVREAARRIYDQG